MITQSRLKELVHYNDATGVFTRTKHVRYNATVGDVVGSKMMNGYLEGSFDGGRYLMHRLAFLYMGGYFPELSVDHENRIKDDNRWCNLREATPQCQVRNIGNQSNNTSGVKGIWFNKLRGKWVAEIKVDYKKRSLGHYLDFDDAVCARLAAEQCLDWSGCETTSPAFLFVNR